MTRRITTLSLLLLATTTLTFPAPMRMRNQQGVFSSALLEQDEQQPSPTPSLSCVVQHLQEALNHVDISYNFQGVSCYTITHANIHSLLVKLESLVEYTVGENIFSSDNLTSSPNSANNLLQTLDSSLRSIASYVGNVTVELKVDDQINDTGLQCTTTEFCQTNCDLCQASCHLYRLKYAVNDLIGLLESDWVDPCDVCVSTALQTAALDARNILNTTVADLIPTTPYYCTGMVLRQFPVCTKPLELLERLENISSVMNSSHSVFNDYHLSLQLMVERLRNTILPETRAALETLEEQECPELAGFDTGTECESVSPSQIAEEVISLLPGSRCGLQQEVVIGLRTLNLLRFNYIHFIDRQMFLKLL